MGSVAFLGLWSDRLTKWILSRNSQPGSDELVRDREGFVRRAQFSAIMSTSQPMMMANIVNSLALLALEGLVGPSRFGTVVWCLVVMTFAGMGWWNAVHFRARGARPTASVRAPGKVVVSSLLLAVIWCYPLFFILPQGNLLEIAFVSALTAGMIAGGALALYPVPLAAFLYTALLSVVAFVMLTLSGILPSLPFGLIIATFSFVVLYSVGRHTGMFLSEMVGKMEAERQRDMVSLLLDTYQDEGGQYLWRCNAVFGMSTDPEPLMQMLDLDPTVAGPAHLTALLRRAQVEPYDPASAACYDQLCNPEVDPPVRFEMTLRLPNGHCLKMAGRQTVREGGRLAGFHGYVKDITTEVQANETVYHLATRDTMTGLLNYAEFKNRAAALLKTAPRGKDMVLFLFLDADNLKTVNDNYGHAVGDQLIETMAARFETLLPTDSLVARKGGDEFVALCRMPPGTAIKAWATSVMVAINRSFRCGGIEIPISCSIGVSYAQSSIRTHEELELEADRALYFAKSTGKRQVSLYDAEIGAKIHKGHVLASDLENALNSEGVGVDFQPIVDLNNGHILGAEALVRWTHPLLGSVEPQQIVAIAQTEELGQALFQHVLARACLHARDWPGQPFVSVNIDSGELQRVNLAATVSAILAKCDMPADRLWLEVTESELLLNSPAVHSNLAALRRAGVRIAVDDFGAGYSSLSYIGRYPSDIIKIDKSLIQACDVSASSKIMLKAMKALAEVNGFEVVAEGVEAPGEIAALRRKGFEMAQGFAFHRPMAPDRLRAVLRRQMPNVAVLDRLDSAS